MGTIIFGDAIVNGNFAPLTKRRPKNWTNKDYKLIVPYKFKWRERIGKVVCDCKVCEEHYQPYYGFIWYHSAECALMKYIKQHPQVLNLKQYYFRDMTEITQTGEQ